ncbi:hypothetical protein GCM10020255_097920 [Rhodococcus baikonurensis]
MAIDYTRRSGESTPSQAPVSLSKITLTKSAPTVNLAKAGERQGNMRVNLNWSQGAPPKKTGFLAKLAGAGSGAVDLDLGCLYELADGSKGVVQALGNSFGSLTSSLHLPRRRRPQWREHRRREHARQSRRPQRFPPNPHLRDDLRRCPQLGGR